MENQNEWVLEQSKKVGVLLRRGGRKKISLVQRFIDSPDHTFPCGPARHGDAMGSQSLFGMIDTIELIIKK